MDDRREIVEIDLSVATTPRDLHLLLARSLGFPDWYGCNWDAFWDAITGLVAMPRRLRLIGWDHLVTRLPHDARLMQQLLAEMKSNYPDCAAEVEYAATDIVPDPGGR